MEGERCAFFMVNGRYCQKVFLLLGHPFLGPLAKEPGFSWSFFCLCLFWFWTRNFCSTLLRKCERQKNSTNSLLCISSSPRQPTSFQSLRDFLCSFVVLYLCIFSCKEKDLGEMGLTHLGETKSNISF